MSEINTSSAVHEVVMIDAATGAEKCIIAGTKAECDEAAEGSNSISAASERAFGVSQSAEYISRPIDKRLRRNKPGAGRPPTGQPRRINIDVTLLPDIAETAARNAKLDGKSRSAYIEQLIVTDDRARSII